jgi:ribosomal 50S subunit-recycling heat shock protein
MSAVSAVRTARALERASSMQERMEEWLFVSKIRKSRTFASLAMS